MLVPVRRGRRKRKIEIIVIDDDDEIDAPPGSKIRNMDTRS